MRYFVTDIEYHSFEAPTVESLVNPRLTDNDPTSSWHNRPPPPPPPHASGTSSHRPATTKATKIIKKERKCGGFEGHKKRNVEGHVSDRLPRKVFVFFFKETFFLTWHNIFDFHPLHWHTITTYKGTENLQNKIASKSELHHSRLCKLLSTQPDDRAAFLFDIYLFHCGSLWNTNYGYCIGNFVLH